MHLGSFKRGVTLGTCNLVLGSSPMIFSFNCSEIFLFFQKRARSLPLMVKRRLSAHAHIYAFKGRTKAYLRNTKEPGLPLDKSGTTIPTMESLTSLLKVYMFLLPLKLFAMDTHVPPPLCGKLNTWVHFSPATGQQGFSISCSTLKHQ